MEKKINISSFLLFLAIAVYYLPIFNKDYLIKLQELSLFIPTKLFFLTQMKVPGGLLSWMGTFLTQFFYYPWLGSAIFIGLVVLVQFLTIKAFKLAWKHYPLVLVVSFALLLTVTQLGYMIFDIKTQGYAYFSLLGFASVLAVNWAYRTLSSPLIRTLSLALFIILFYPLFGFFALFAGLLAIVYELLQLRKDKQRARLTTVLAGLLTLVLVPYLYYRFYYTQLEVSHIYVSGLPSIALHGPVSKLWWPYLAIVLSFLCLVIFSSLTIRKERSKLTAFAMATIGLLSLYGFVRLNFTDENFHTELSMDFAVFDNRWEDVLKLAKKQKDEPTRMIAMNTTLALQKLNRAGDELFYFPVGNKPTASPWPTRLIVLAGKRMYYQYGKANFCYHWCMEDMVERGMKVESLKYMVKCSLVKGEFELARKYNDVLAKTLFHKDWAVKYGKYIENPKLMLQDKEFNAIRPLTAFEDGLFDDNGALEIFILNNFAKLKEGTPEMFEIGLQSAMMIKDSGLFWPLFIQYINTHKTIPRHYQEAALFFAYFEKKVDVSSLSFNPQVIADFKELLSTIDVNVGNSREMNQKIFARLFQHTYWYYYFFGKNIATP